MAEFEISNEKANELVRKDMDRIQKNLRKFINEKKLTQEQVGDRIGMDRSYVNYLLNQRHASPKLVTLSKLCHVLNINLNDLLK